MHFRIGFCCFFGSLAGWLAGLLAGWLGWAGWLAGLAGLVIPGLSLEGFSALELLGSRRPGTQGLPKRGSDMECIAKIDFWWKLCLMHLGIGFCCFVKALGVILSIIDSKFRCSRLPKRGSGMEGIAKISFWWKSFLMQFGICFCCFFKSLGN